ncbi:hypothetical protein [uncultured Aliiroseovarius sp.]|uniref:hypothetical protein n=1 Tax=uncultured Aliiroseovarius sp. TaxID=1658783 RepID=UPI002599B04B|nr:hypothetical protein [uncultured Aliiroseovarius sp.]
MSSPDVNPEKQKRRHRPVLWLILAGAIVVIVAGMIYSSYLDDSSVGQPTEDSITTDQADSVDDTQTDN